MSSVYQAVADTWETFLKNTGYGKRKQQEDLVEAIAEVIDTTDGGKGCLVGRAGTGTGKSFASVVPALAFRTATDAEGPVLVSTATKALQGQYFKKDLPQIVKAYPTAITFAVLKGRNNYACAQKLSEPNAAATDFKAFERAKASIDGDMADIRPVQHAREHFTISNEDCPGARKCPFAMKGECHFENAKKKASESDVVIVNHALVATDMAVRQKTDGGIRLLPDASILVLDEAHKFEQYVQNAFAWAISRPSLYREGNALLDGPDNYTWQQAVDKFFKLVKFDREDKRNPKEQIWDRNNFRNDEDGETPFPPILDDMIEVMRTAAADWLRETHDNPKAWRLIRRCQRLVEIFERMLPENVEDNDNFWLELTNRDDTKLCYQPQDVSNVMAEHLWPRHPSILLSATPPHDPTGRLGIEQYDTFDCDSPFDYRNNTRLYISRISGKPPMDRNDKELWTQRRHQEMLRLVASSDGRALLLFTSWADLNEAHRVLSPNLSAAGVTILKQDADNEAARTELARQFKADERSVLFGTQSFFEGIDVPGPSCQLVIISKLPFPAMMDAKRGGQLDFRDVMLPEMRQHLVQAAGRLIRTHDDKGVVAVMDDRLRTMGYGKIILANVAPFDEMPLVKNLQDALDYLESIDPEVN